jgi:hypothetical protein
VSGGGWGHGRREQLIGVDPRDSVRAALEDLDFPASKQDIVAHVERKGVDEEALRAVRALPLADYASATEVLRSVPFDVAASEGRTAADKAAARRTHKHPGLAEPLKETPRSPVEEELGRNEGS